MVATPVASVNCSLRVAAKLRLPRSGMGGSNMPLKLAAAVACSIALADAPAVAEAEALADSPSPPTTFKVSLESGQFEVRPG